MPDVSVLTLTRNHSHFQRLDGSLDLQGVDAEKILVNNANDPRITADALQRGWLVVEPGYNTSFSAGNNLAAEVASSQDLLLLNDDVIPEEGFVQTLLKDRGGVMGTKLLHESGTINHAGGGLHASGQTHHIGRHAARDAHTGMARTPWVTFAAVLIPQRTWVQLGGLDCSYHYGWEDVDFCLRALQAGHDVRCNRDAVAVHDECGTRPRGGQQDQHNAEVFATKWQGKIDGILAEWQSVDHMEGV